MQEKFIQFNNVTYVYESDEEGAPGFTALKNINLDIYKGEFVAILGHNGSGKSTLAKLCNAIFDASEGTVTVDGIIPDTEEKGDLIRRKVGMVFQNPDNQIVATIVEDDVAFGPENLGVDPKEIRERVDYALKSVNMYDLREREPHTLSGGQKQRVAIAGVVAMETDCIVLDEPTAMLDPKGRQEVMDTIIRFHEMGKTVVLVTHFMDEAVKADRVVVMDSGRIIATGTPREVFSKADFLKEHSLDVPQSAELCSKLGLGNDVLNVEECVEKIMNAAGGKK